MSAPEIRGRAVKAAQMTLRAAKYGANGVFWQKDFGR
jgi:hypothetical protein